MKWIMDNITMNNVPPRMMELHDKFIEFIS